MTLQVVAVNQGAFENWAGTVRTTPREWVRPAADEEVQAAVAAAARGGRRVRVIGSGHSWSPIAAPDDVALRLDGIPPALTVSADRRRALVGGGVTLAWLVEQLAAAGLGLPILGSVDAQAIAGATATGTHGSSLRHGNLSSLVTRLWVVDGRGELVTLCGDELAGARVHLGALGVVTRLEVRVEPMYRLEERCELVPFEEGCDRLDELVRSAEHVKVWWVPHTEHLLVFTCRRTDEAPTFDEAQWARERWMSETVFPALLGVGGRVPALIPWLNRAIAAVHFRPYRAVGRYDRMLMVAGAPRHRETEVSLPLGRASAALRYLRGWVRRYGARLDFIQELRFGPADDAWMSPSYGRDSCYLGVYATHTPELDALFGAMRAWAEAHEGRPHWGKELDVTPERVRAWYPAAWRFAELVGRLDPAGTFRNPMMDAVLGSADAPL